MATPININEARSQPMPERGILSQTLLKNEYTSLVHMKLAPGEELSEHTSKFPVWIYTIEGEGSLDTPSGSYPMSEGGWIYLEPSEEHAIHPKTQLHFLLIIMKQGRK